MVRWLALGQCPSHPHHLKHAYKHQTCWLGLAWPVVQSLLASASLTFAQRHQWHLCLALLPCTCAHVCAAAVYRSQHMSLLRPDHDLHLIRLIHELPSTHVNR